MGLFGEKKPTLPCRLHIFLIADGDNLIVSNDKQNSKEVVPISNIQSFSVKDGTRLADGTFTFATAQAATGSVHLGWGVSVASGAEKSFRFAYTENGAAKELQNYLIDYQNQPPAPASQGSSVVAVADEIRSLKALLDDGIITQDEFDAKKKQLLGI